MMLAQIAHGMTANRRRIRLIICLWCVLYGPLPAADIYVAARQELVHLIEDDVRATSAYLGQESLDSRVLTALASVPRLPVFLDMNLCHLNFGLWHMKIDPCQSAMARPSRNHTSWQ